MNKGTCQQTWQPDLDPYDPYSGRWEPASTSCLPHMWSVKLFLNPKLLCSLHFLRLLVCFFKLILSAFWSFQKLHLVSRPLRSLICNQAVYDLGVKCPHRLYLRLAELGIINMMLLLYCVNYYRMHGSLYQACVPPYRKPRREGKCMGRSYST